MTPHELLLLIRLLHALAGASPANAATPHQPPTIEMQSLGDVGDAVIRCYHPTSRLQTVNVIQAPWNQQRVWNAASSAVLRIQWRGTLKSYVSTVALVERQGKVHAVVLQENSLLPASKRCALDGWVAARQ